MKNNTEVEDKKFTEPDRGHLDFLVSIILFIMGIYVLVESLFYYLSQNERFGIPYYASAGFLPSIIGTVIVLLSIKLFLETIKTTKPSVRIAQLIDSFNKITKNKYFYKTLLGLGVFYIYIYILLGRINFFPATFITTWAILLVNKFNKTWKTTLLMGFIALASAGGIVLVFDVLFNVPMP